jgi:hypothetical protein
MYALETVNVSHGDCTNPFGKWLATVQANQISLMRSHLASENCSFICKRIADCDDLFQVHVTFSFIQSEEPPKLYFEPRAWSMSTPPT